MVFGEQHALPCMVQCPPIPPYHFVLLCVLEGSMCRHKGIGMNRPKKTKVEVPQLRSSSR